MCESQADDGRVLCTVDLEWDQSWRELFVLKLGAAGGLCGPDMFARALIIHTPVYSPVD